jgi:hypothetical protein
MVDRESTFAGAGRVAQVQAKQAQEREALHVILDERVARAAEGVRDTEAELETMTLGVARAKAQVDQLKSDIVAEEDKKIEIVRQRTALVQKQATAMRRMYQQKIDELGTKQKQVGRRLSQYQQSKAAGRRATVKLQAAIVNSQSSLKQSRYQLDTSEQSAEAVQDKVIEHVENALGLCMNLDLLVAPDLQCGQCNGLLDKPVTLFPCSHTFCKECLPNMREVIQGSEFYLCPSCLHRCHVTSTCVNETMDSLCARYMWWQMPIKGMERMYTSAAERRIELMALSTNVEDQQNINLQKKVARRFREAFKANSNLVTEMFEKYMTQNNAEDGDGGRGGGGVGGAGSEITYAQLRSGLCEAGVDFTDEEFDRIIVIWDEDASGMIDYFEFASSFKNSQMTLDVTEKQELEAAAAQEAAENAGEEGSVGCEGGGEGGEGGAGGAGGGADGTSKHDTGDASGVGDVGDASGAGIMVDGVYLSADKLPTDVDDDETNEAEALAAVEALSKLVPTAALKSSAAGEIFRRSSLISLELRRRRGSLIPINTGHDGGGRRRGSLISINTGHDGGGGHRLERKSSLSPRSGRDSDTGGSGGSGGGGEGWSLVRQKSTKSPTKKQASPHSASSLHVTSLMEISAEDILRIEGKS